MILRYHKWEVAFAFRVCEVIARGILGEREQELRLGILDIISQAGMHLEHSVKNRWKEIPLMFMRLFNSFTLICSCLHIHS